MNMLISQDIKLIREELYRIACLYRMILFLFNAVFIVTSQALGSLFYTVSDVGQDQSMLSISIYR